VIRSLQLGLPACGLRQFNASDRSACSLNAPPRAREPPLITQ